MSALEVKSWPAAGEINVGSYSGGQRAAELSNFSPHTFILDGQLYANVEAFVQSIKYPAASEQRAEIAEMRAPRAKRKSPKEPPALIEWNGKEIPYRSYEHLQLQAAAIFAKFDQNDDVLSLLLATGNQLFTHDLSSPDRAWTEKPTTCLPATVFTQILVETRQHFFREMGIMDSEIVGEYPPTYVTEELVAYARF